VTLRQVSFAHLFHTLGNQTDNYTIQPNYVDIKGRI